MLGVIGSSKSWLGRLYTSGGGRGRVNIFQPACLSAFFKTSSIYTTYTQRRKLKHMSNYDNEIYLKIIKEKVKNPPQSCSLAPHTCDSCLTCLCAMLASLRKGSPFMHTKKYIAANQVQPICSIYHISWPSRQASLCFPDISNPTALLILLFSGCLFDRNNISPTHRTHVDSDDIGDIDIDSTSMSLAPVKCEMLRNCILFSKMVY